MPLQVMGAARRPVPPCSEPKAAAPGVRLCPTAASSSLRLPTPQQWPVARNPVGLPAVFPNWRRRSPCLRAEAAASSAVPGSSGGSGDIGAGGSGGGGGGGGDPTPGWGWGGDEGRAVMLGLMVGTFAAFKKWLVVWCTDESHGARITALMDAGLLSLLGPLAAALVWLNPPWMLQISLILTSAGLAHLIGEMILSASQPGADWKWDLWLHHISSSLLLGLVVSVRVPGFVMDAMKLLVVECTTGVVAAFTEARRAKKLRGSHSAVLGGLMLGAFTFRAAWSTWLLANFIRSGRPQALMAAGGVVAAAISAFIVPLWALNYLWASKVYISALKIAGVIPSSKATAEETDGKKQRK